MGALRADPAAGIIWYHDEPLLSGIPEAAWRYRLGNRSALEHVLAQYRDRTPKDPTIRAQFDTYRLADHLPELSLLLARVATVSARTMAIVDELAARSPLNHANRAGASGPAPVPPAVAGPLGLDVAAPREPSALPRAIRLALSRAESDFYLEHSGTDRQGDALECLLQRHGHEWPAGVAALDTTSYWQGPKFRPGSHIKTLILRPTK